MPGIGILFGLLLAIALAAAAVVLIVRGARDPSRQGVGFGLLVLALIAAFYGWRAHVEPDEYNPSVTRGAVVGAWTSGRSRIVFDAAGGFQADVTGGARDRTGLGQEGGTWELRDWNLTLRGEGGSVHRLRVVANGDALRIIEQPDDLDGWTPWRGFGRSGGSRVVR